MEFFLVWRDHKKSLVSMTRAIWTNDGFYITDKEIV